VAQGLCLSDEEPGSTPPGSSPQNHHYPDTTVAACREAVLLSFNSKPMRNSYVFTQDHGRVSLDDRAG
jgi:hypothetical protein